MTLELVLLIVGVFDVGFIAGCWWNSHAYARGVVDGLRERGVGR